jgi:hypothetical protein
MIDKQIEDCLAVYDRRKLVALIKTFIAQAQREKAEEILNDTRAPLSLNGVKEYMKETLNQFIQRQFENNGRVSHEWYNYLPDEENVTVVIKEILLAIVKYIDTKN